nr:FeoA family protein [Geminocystis herdmanii]
MMKSSKTENIHWQKFSYWGEKSNLEDETTTTLGQKFSSSSYALSQAKTGATVWVVGFTEKGGTNKFLGMGLIRGTKLQIVNAQPSGSVMIAIQDQRMGIGAGMANKILVSDTQLIHQEENLMTNTTRVYLREMVSGTVGRVLGYEKAMRGYKGKLLSMGLTPRTEFTVIRVAPLGDPIEIKVRDFHLSLRKQEADTLIVEIVNS